MYDCSTIMKLLHPHLDGELDVKESIRVQTHLQECPFCRENFMAEKAFRDLVHQHATTKPAPQFAKHCVSAALARETRAMARSRSRWRSPRLLAPLGIAVAALIMLVVSTGLFRDPTSGLVKAAVTTHHAYLDDPASLQIQSSDTRLVSAWLERRLRFSLDLPTQAVPNLHLVGGRIANDGDHRAAHLVYRLGESTVSLLMTPPQEVRLSGQDVISFKNILFHPATIQGLHTLQWSDSRHTYVLVSDQPDALYEACVICHGSVKGRDVISGFRNRV